MCIVIKFQTTLCATWISTLCVKAWFGVQYAMWLSRLAPKKKYCLIWVEQGAIRRNNVNSKGWTCQVIFLQCLEMFFKLGQTMVEGVECEYVKLWARNIVQNDAFTTLKCVLIHFRFH
jgi:hypothetical protein